MLKKSKVAVFSDLHLGIYGNSEQWHDIALKWCDWIVQDLKKKKIKDILFLGDFFDNRSEVSVQTIHIASKILSNLSEFNIIMIVGNHDAFYKNRSDVHSLGLIHGHSNIKVVDSVYDITEFGKRMLFVPWNSDIPDEKYDYIFGHFEITNFKMNNFKVCTHGLSPSSLLSKSKCVFSGHFHNRYHKDYKEGSIYYVGNTFPMDFSDVSNIKGYYLLDIEDGDLEFVENKVSPKFKKILISKLKEYSKIDIQNNIIKVVIDIDISDKLLEKVNAYIAKCSPNYVVIDYQVNSVTVDDIEDVESVDLLNQLEEYITQLNMEDEQTKRVSLIISKLYDNNK